MTISYIIPSLNRLTLHRTIASIEMRPGDEICVEYDIPRSNRWGNDQRNKAIARATGDYLAFIDDDDQYIPGYRQIMEDAMQKNPGLPNLFKMRYPNGEIKWSKKEVVPGNVSTPMILVPNNRREMLYHWQGARNMADFIFIDKWKWPKEDIVWREEVIVNLDHNDNEVNQDGK